MFPRFNFIRNFATSVKPVSVSKVLHLKPCNQQLKIMGWVKSQRRYKERSFIHIDDGSSFHRLQVVIPKSLCSTALTYQTCVCIEGTLVESLGQRQASELVADKISILSPGAPLEYPFTEKGTYLEEDLRLQPHFRSRTRTFPAMYRVRSKAKQAIHSYFEKEGFINIDTPILTTNDCEGGGEVFEVKDQRNANSEEKKPCEGTFNRTVYLSVSGQLHLEAMASGLSRVYNFNPAFRGEKGSRLHLHEFWMVEMEESFLEGKEGYQAVMDRLENLFKFTLKEIMENSMEDLEHLWKTNNKKEVLEKLLPQLIESPFVKMKFKDALKILDAHKDKLKHPVTFASDSLNRESELFLTEYLNNIPVFITDWPSSSKPFYMYSEDLEGQNISFGTDLLAPFVGEIAGGSLREHRYDVLKTRIEALNVMDSMRWYLELRKFGYAPSGGFGFGFERFLQFISGMNNIKDTICFPRGSGQCEC